MTCLVSLRRIGLLGAAGLLALGVSGCSGSSGGDGPAREEAPSTAQFCGALTDFQADLADADPSDPTTYVQGLKDAATRLGAVGTPEEMPAEAGAGLATRLAAITALPQAPTPADLAALGKTDKDPGVRAFDGYAATTCPAA